MGPPLLMSQYLATNTDTSERVVFQVANTNPNDDDIDEIRIGFANYYGWDPNKTKIEHCKPPPDMRHETLQLTNKSTGEKVKVEIYCDGPDENVLENARIKFAGERDWDIGDTTIRYVRYVPVYLIAINKATGQHVPFTTKMDQNATDEETQLHLKNILDKFADEYGWEVDTTKIEYTEPPLDPAVRVDLRATNTDTGDWFSCTVTTADPDAVSALPAVRERFLTGLRSKFAEKNGWAVGDTKIEYAEPMLV
jgi:predicted nucleotidyltransferase